MGGGVIDFYLRFIPGDTFVSPAPYSPVNHLDGPSTRDRTYFFRLQAQVFRVKRRCYTISTNIYYTLFIFWFGCLNFVWSFGDAVRRIPEKSRWCHCLRKRVRIYDSIFSNSLRSYLTVLKSNYERIGNLYDINIFVQMILSLISLPHTYYLTSKFNSLIFLKKIRLLNLEVR